MVGRLTADPELRRTQNGIASCKFNIAVNRKFADKNTGERQADFITCIAWRQTAEFVAKYFSKGKMIALEGELRNNNYQDRNHPDVTHYCIEVAVDNVEFTGGKNENGGSSSNAPSPAPQPIESMSYGNLSDFEEILSDGDVPF